MTLRKPRRVVALLLTGVVFGGLLLAQALLVGSAAPGPAVSTETRLVPDERGWSMFGGTPGRNMVNLRDRDIVTAWSVAWFEDGAGRREADLPRSRNIKWVARLGSRSYGGPVVAGGKVFVGTNNEAPRDPKVKGDRGILMCFAEKDGQFLWQAVHDKHPDGNVHDWPREGLVSTPAVVGNRVYYVSNRCELVCAFTEARPGTREAYILWKLDMMAQLGVKPHNMSSCCPLVVGDRLFVVTSNGIGEDHINIPAPQAPSFIAVNRWTGKVIWQDNSPGPNILHGQWSNPTYARIGDQGMVIFPGGDGWLRAFEPATGKVLWKFDCNPKGVARQRRNDFIATPVIHDTRLYIGTGQDPEHFEGDADLWCIDLVRAVEKGRTNRAADVSPVNNNFNPQAAVNRDSALAWHIDMGRTLSTCAAHDGLVYAGEMAGYLHCLNAETGERYWHHDLKAALWGSPYWVDGKVYVATEDGDVWIFPHGKDRKEPIKIEMEQPIRSTPVAANGVLYIMTESFLYAIAAK